MSRIANLNVATITVTVQIFPLDRLQRTHVGTTTKTAAPALIMVVPPPRTAAIAPAGVTILANQLMWGLLSDQLSVLLLGLFC